MSMSRAPPKAASGDRAKGDKLQAGAVQLPPLQLAENSIDLLKSLWN